MPKLFGARSSHPAKAASLAVISSASPVDGVLAGSGPARAQVAPDSAAGHAVQSAWVDDGASGTGAREVSRPIQ
ncbi:hypothetical protein [Kitasatospora sp. HPMI-4]|uniref:hypothetical protein n=1 Tax=Kitasatospora sp. HPMI-4 TaxID=3448443 RepID=UPI003F1B2398